VCLGCWISPSYGPFSLGARFETYESFISLIFQFFSGRGKPRITEIADMGVRLYYILCPRYYLTHHDMLDFYGEELTVPCPVPRAIGPPIVGCLQLLMYNIHSDPPCLQANCSICSQHAMGTVHPQ